MSFKLCEDLILWIRWNLFPSGPFRKQALVRTIPRLPADKMIDFKGSR
jgi:hypothetical protein